MSDVVAYLQGKGLVLKPAAGDEVHLACVFCGEDSSKRGRMYVNTAPENGGVFQCQLCGQKGNLVTLKRHFGDPVNDKEDRDWQLREVHRVAAAYYHDALADEPDALAYLKRERGLTIETIQRHQIGWAGGGLHSYLREQGFKFVDIKATGLVTEGGSDFLRDQITLPYHVNGNVVLIRGKQIGGKYLTPHGAKTRLFNSDAVWNATTVLATEGEFDCLSAEQLGYSAVGCPGASTWQDSWDSYFSDVARLYVVFDPDEAGRRGADKIRLRLAPRARVVNLPVPQDMDASMVDLNWLVVHRDLDEYGINALLGAATGSTLITVDMARAAYDEVQALVGIRFGVPDLDAVLVPGVLPTQVVVTLARSGVGKTLWILNTMFRMAAAQPGLKFLFVSLEQTRWEWWERAQRIYAFTHPLRSESDSLQFWRARLLMTDQNRIGEEMLVKLLDEYKFEMGSAPDVVFVDYLGYWAQSFRGERYERTSDAMMSLKAIAKEHKVVMMAPHQVSRGAEPGEEPNPDDARDSGVVLETSDFLFTLWNPDSKIGAPISDREGQVYCRVAKSRHGGVGTKVQYAFSPLTLAMVPIGDPLYGRAMTEIAWRKNEDLDASEGRIPTRMTWREAVELHAHPRERAAVAAVLGDSPDADGY